jgi:hypothetical protein
MGFVRQMFQHAVKQAPAAFGPGTLRRLDEGFGKSGCHIRELLVEIAAGTAAIGTGAAPAAVAAAR